MDGKHDDDLPLPKQDEGTRVRLEHDLYLKAVNNPARRRMLEILSKMPLSKKELGARLVDENIIRDPSEVSYHLDFLAKARCVIMDGDTVKITQGGQVVDYFK